MSGLSYSMGFEQSSVIKRRIDDLYFEARIVCRGEIERTGCIEKIVYLDDQRMESMVPIEECVDALVNEAEHQNLLSGNSIEGPELAFVKGGATSTVNQGGKMRIDSELSSQSALKASEKLLEDSPAAQTVVKECPGKLSGTSMSNAKVTPETFNLSSSVPIGDPTSPSTLPVWSGPFPEATATGGANSRNTELKGKQEDGNERDAGEEVPPPPATETTTTTTIATDAMPHQDPDPTSVAGPCLVCGVSSKFRCARCGAAFYCTRAHQRQDWAPSATQQQLRPVQQQQLGDPGNAAAATYSGDQGWRVGVDSDDDDDDDDDDDGGGGGVEAPRTQRGRSFHYKRCAALTSVPLKPKPIAAALAGGTDWLSGCLAACAGNDTRGGANQAGCNQEGGGKGDGGSGEEGVDLESGLVDVGGGVAGKRSLDEGALDSLVTGHGGAAGLTSKRGGSEGRSGSINGDVENWEKWVAQRVSGVGGGAAACISELVGSALGGGGGGGAASSSSSSSAMPPPAARDRTHSASSPPSSPKGSGCASMDPCFTTPPRQKRRVRGEKGGGGHHIEWGLEVEDPSSGNAGDRTAAGAAAGGVAAAATGVSAECVQQLLEMGVVGSEAEATSALAACGNSVEHAIEFVFGGGLQDCGGGGAGGSGGGGLTADALARHTQATSIAGRATAGLVGCGKGGGGGGGGASDEALSIGSAGVRGCGDGGSEDARTGGRRRDEDLLEDLEDCRIDTGGGGVEGGGGEAFAGEIYWPHVSVTGHGSGHSGSGAGELAGRGEGGEGLPFAVSPTPSSASSSGSSSSAAVSSSSSLSSSSSSAALARGSAAPSSAAAAASSFLWSGTGQSAFASAAPSPSSPAISSSPLPSSSSSSLDPQRIHSGSSPSGDQPNAPAPCGGDKNKTAAATSKHHVGTANLTLVGEFQKNVTRGEFSGSPWHRSLTLTAYDVEEDEKDEEDAGGKLGNGLGGNASEGDGGGSGSNGGAVANTAVAAFPEFSAKDLLLVIVEEPPLRPLGPNLGLPPPPQLLAAQHFAAAAPAALAPAAKDREAADEDTTAAASSSLRLEFGRRFAMLLPKQEVVTLSRVHLPTPRSLDRSRPPNWLHPDNALARASTLVDYFIEARLLANQDSSSPSSAAAAAAAAGAGTSAGTATGPAAAMTYVLCAQATRRVVAACAEISWGADPLACLEACATPTPAAAFAASNRGSAGGAGGGDGGWGGSGQDVDYLDEGDFSKDENAAIAASLAAVSEAPFSPYAGVGGHPHRAPPLIGPHHPAASRAGSRAATTAGVVVEDEAKVALLVETMGIPEGMAREALRNSHNDIDAAANTFFG